MSKFRIQKIPVGTLGIVQVNIPMLVFRKGKPQVLIMATQHGGELSGLLVIASLIQRLKLSRGTCIIAPIVNPLGAVFRMREEPVERADLNRSYPGSASKAFAQRITKQIFDIAQKSDCVLDLHTFARRDTCILGVLGRGSTPITKKANRLMRALRPDAVWEINYAKDEDRRFIGDIDSSLLQQGVPVMGLELPLEEEITDEQIARTVDGIIMMLAMLGMVSISPVKKNNINIPVYNARYLYADDSGIFFPEQEVLGRVERGDRIGRLQVLPNFHSKIIRAADEGMILSLYQRGFIRTGEKIASIGKRTRML